MKKTAFLLCLFAAACSKNVKDIYADLIGKELVFPDGFLFVENLSDTIPFAYHTDFKIINYIDSMGCFSCKSQLPMWSDFIIQLKEMKVQHIEVLLVMHPREQKEAAFVIKRDNYHYPVCIDINDDFNRLNHFPEDDNFRCFLLDENNRVILIGNPVQNPRIRELYINTICERLGVERPNVTNTQQDKYHADLGTFAWQEAQKAHLVVLNTESENMQIDSIRSSCECTTAVVSKNTITQGDSAVVTITYKAEQAGDFMREVYVYLHNAEPITMRIEGRAE